MKNLNQLIEKYESEKAILKTRINNLEETIKKVKSKDSLIDTKNWVENDLRRVNEFLKDLKGLK